MKRNDYLTFCHVCPAHCSRKITTEEGRIVRVEKDQESGLPDEWCTFKRAKTIKEVTSHPDRLKYPLKRVGARGEGKWSRISWDEALGEIAEKLNYFKKEFGAESLAFCLGEPKGMEFAFAQRFASVYGTPNVATPGNY
jgi:thiosulfate reductase/polysulfide reductase chain A